MKMHIKHILVMTDLYEESQRVVNFAAALAEKFDARLTVLHAIEAYPNYMNEMMSTSEYDDFVVYYRANNIRILRSLQANSKEAKNRINLQTMQGSPKIKTIMKHIKKNNYDLIVLASHGRSWLYRWLLGNFAEQLLRFSPVPIITTGHFPELFSINKILLPIDFSENSKNAIDLMIPFVRKFNAQLEVLHVVKPETHPLQHENIRQKLKDDSVQLLQEPLEYHGEKIKYVVTEGQISKEIVRYAQHNQVDLIMMVARGLTGFKHFIKGSTTEKVIRSATCPVLAVGRNCNIAWTSSSLESKSSENKGAINYATGNQHFNEPAIYF